MKKTNPRLGDDELRAEYDFAAMKGGVRGKYATLVREGTNVVLLEADVAEAFPTEAAVNEALRGVLNTTRAVRNTGGLPNKALQPTSRTRSARRKSTKRARAARG
jgi:hypothetical protein